MGPGTPVRKAALRNLGNQWPETGSLGQVLSRERLEKESRPARLGTWATSDSPLCLSTLCRKKRERLQARVGPRHTTVHGPPTGHTCARGSTCVPVFNHLNNPRRSTSPGFSDKETQRLNHLPADPQLGAGGSKPALSHSVTVLSVTELF